MIEALNKKTLEQVYDKKSLRYDRYHNLVTFNADQRGRELLVKHAVSSGCTVLDAGGGTGSTALLAARQAGHEGKVTLLDLSQGMMNIAKKRAEEARLTDRIEFIKGDIDALPFPDNAFDVVLSTYSACPLGDPSAGALELLRVVKPKGLLGMAHSAAPKGTLSKIIGGCVESILWKFPSMSLGCRAVEVLPALLQAGATLQFKKYIGSPFWPFLVFTVRKESE